MMKELSHEQKLITPGKWFAEFDEYGKAIRVVYEESYRKILGVGPDDGSFAPEKWQERIHPEDAARVLAHMTDVTSRHPEGKDYDIEYRMLTKSGYHWFHDYARYIRRENGTPSRCDGVVFDIQTTMDRFASLEKYEKEEQLRNELLERMAGSEGLFLIDCTADSRKILHDRNEVARQYCDIGSYSESVHKYIDTFVARADRKMMREVTSVPYMLERLKAADEYKVEYRDTTSGIQRFYEMRVSKFSDTQVLQSFVEKDKVIIDRMIFNKLEEEFFALYGVDLDSGLIKIQKDSPYYPVGPVGTVKKYAPMMRRFASAFEGETREFFERISDTAYLKRRFAKEDKVTYTYRSHFLESERWVSVTELVLTRHEDGTPSIWALGFSLLDEDAVDKENLQVELKKQKVQLQAAYEAAEVANRSKTSFLFNMSHDIRTPMNAIVGFTNMAKRFVGDEEKVTDYLDKIDLSGQQLLKLINQVLEMARIESGKVEFDNKPVNIKEKFDAMVTILAEQANVNGLEFHHSLHDVRHSHILADDARMSQITLNIAGNAMKYTLAGGRIDFTLREIPARKDGYATFVFTVEDTGIGMSKEYLSRLFEPFSREKSTTVSKVQGTGLGMSIVKSLVDLLGGNIDVQSELGKGTKFDITIDFLIDDENGLNAESQAKPADGVDFSGCRILLVEDNELNREIAKFILEDGGATVEEADDGDVAVEMVKKVADRGDYGYYDFILMDIQMPRMNGYEATAKIREIPGPEGVHVPIIAMTANAFAEDRRNAMEAGMDAHLSKPIDIAKLWDTLAKFK